MKNIILFLIRFYQKLLSTKKACRFEPTCSEYAYEAIKKYGIIFGGWKGIKRIFSCNPLNKGGYDPLK